MSDRIVAYGPGDYNPDVLTCLANLSNDEVFTPPDVANAMLDQLPKELFESPDTTFLDPATKTGVFLREIVKRLNNGLENVIPDKQKRIDHILHKQVFGIAITELTSLLARRTVYCSKHANCKYSISKFDDVQGNIRFVNTQHIWQNGKCVWCGASSILDKGEEQESHAYEFIHTKKLEEIFGMKFDVIISNPPYQLSDGGSKASAKPIYQLFVERAEILNPRYMSMIIPSRWFSGGKGLNKFRENMLNDTRLRTLVDFFDSTEVFPGVDISGGICYFLWDRDNKGDCNVVSFRNGKSSTLTRPLIQKDDNSFIRFNEAISIVKKVQSQKEELFYKGISSRKPFGLDTKTSISPNKETGMIYAYAYPKDGYVLCDSIEKKYRSLINKIKVCISYAYGERGSFPYQVIAKPFVAPKHTCCTETYLVVRVVDSVKEANNIISYMKTKFFRFLVLLKKNTQHGTKEVYGYVPALDFSKPWTDEELYVKYELTKDEIAFIDSMIKPMELDGDGQ